MPKNKGYNLISDNIKELLDKGYGQKMAKAIAVKSAQSSKKKETNKYSKDVISLALKKNEKR